MTHAGLQLREPRDGRPVEAWLSFACHAHADRLVGARELLDRDRAILDDWRRREADARAGRGWRRPDPLAVGARARRLVERARAAR